MDAKHTGERKALSVAEARRELAQIAERQAELQAIVDAAPKSLVQPGGADGFGLVDIFEHDSFASFKQRNAYADALDTLLMLRHQPGSEAANGENMQWSIETEANDLEITYWDSLDFKLRSLSPFFSTEEAAKSAIDTIGADRILRMFRTLHGVAA
jgi:hypothetical protein